MYEYLEGILIVITAINYLMLGVLLVDKLDPTSKYSPAIHITFIFIWGILFVVMPITVPLKYIYKSLRKRRRRNKGKIKNNY